jgi:hypothetical protein
MHSVYCSHSTEEVSDIVLDIGCGCREHILACDSRCRIAWRKGDDHPDADIFLKACLMHFSDAAAGGKYTVCIGPQVH